MLPDEEEMREFVKEIPKTPLGKLKAMNKLFFKEDNLGEAFRQANLFFLDLIKNNPDFLEALKDCKTEGEIKEGIGNFFRENPKIVDETLTSMLMVKRDKWEEKEKENEEREKGKEEEKRGKTEKKKEGGE